MEAVRPLSEVAWVSVRQRDAAAIQADFEAAARAKAEMLLLDAGAGPPEALLVGARQYRVSRSDSRVVLLAPGRLPGDPVVAGMVAIGIYNILARDEASRRGSLLRNALTGPPASYAHAARWDAAHPGVGQPRATPERVRVVERVQRVPLGGRPVVLAVVAAAPGAGATYTALAVAGHLARHGYRVGLVELCPRPALAWSLRSLSRDPGTGPDGVCLVPGVTVYALPIPAAGSPHTSRVPPSVWSPSCRTGPGKSTSSSTSGPPHRTIPSCPRRPRHRHPEPCTRAAAGGSAVDGGDSASPLALRPPPLLPRLRNPLPTSVPPCTQARPCRSIAALLSAVSRLWRRLRPVLLPVALVYLAASWARLALVSGPADRPPAWAAPGTAILRIFGLVD